MRPRHWKMIAFRQFYSFFPLSLSVQASLKVRDSYLATRAYFKHVSGKKIIKPARKCKVNFCQERYVFRPETTAWKMFIVSEWAKMTCLNFIILRMYGKAQEAHTHMKSTSNTNTIIVIRIAWNFYYYYTISCALAYTHAHTYRRQPHYRLCICSMFDSTSTKALRNKWKCCLILHNIAIYTFRLLESYGEKETMPVYVYSRCARVASLSLCVFIRLIKGIKSRTRKYTFIVHLIAHISCDRFVWGETSKSTKAKTKNEEKLYRQKTASSFLTRFFSFTFDSIDLFFRFLSRWFFSFLLLLSPFLLIFASIQFARQKLTKVNSMFTLVNLSSERTPRTNHKRTSFSSFFCVIFVEARWATRRARGAESRSMLLTFLQ